MSLKEPKESIDWVILFIIKCVWRDLNISGIRLDIWGLFANVRVAVRDWNAGNTGGVEFDIISGRLRETCWGGLGEVCGSKYYCRGAGVAEEASHCYFFIGFYLNEYRLAIWREKGLMKRRKKEERNEWMDD
jgi:hypothetical protein